MTSNSKVSLGAEGKLTCQHKYGWDIGGTKKETDVKFLEFLEFLLD